jgi:hypothetical protein
MVNEEPNEGPHDNLEDDGGDISGPTVFAEVSLAKTVGVYIFHP